MSGQSLGEVTFKTQPDPRKQPGEVKGGTWPSLHEVFKQRAGGLQPAQPRGHPTNVGCVMGVWLKAKAQ